MAISPRFAFDTAVVVGGGFLAVTAMTFSAPVAGWLGFGVFTAVAAGAALAGVLTRHPAHRIGYGLVGLLGAWSLIAALVFSGTALTWLVFAGAVALAAAALGDLTAHELTTERVVHQLDVRTAEETRPTEPATPAAVAA